MQWLANLKIKYKIILMLFFPILGLLYFSLIIVTDKYHIAHEMDNIDKLATVAVKTAEVIHQIQLERVASVTFLKNHGSTQFVDELIQEHLKTDQLINEFKNLLKDLATEELSNIFHQPLEQIFQVIKNISAQRKAIFHLKISELKAIEGYGEINQVLIDFIKQIASSTKDKNIFTLELAYINFLVAKELAALERSMLVNALTQRYFEGDEFQHFVKVVAQQQVYRQIIFKYLATEEQKAFFEQTVTGKAIEETQKIREMLYKTANDGIIEHIEPDFWAKVQTEKIELLKTVEIKLSDDLRAKAHHIHHHAYQEFNLALLIVGIILTLAVALVMIVLKGMTTRLSQAVEIANAIAVGHLDNLFDEVNTKDETGELLQAFTRMQTQLRGRIREDKRIADEALRINRALDNVTTHILIADNHYKIIYLNDSAQKLFTTEEKNIRKDLPHFEASHILGATIDSFHKNPSDQYDILESLTSVYYSTFPIGDLTINTIITPVIDGSGKRLGTVVELINRTQEIATEQEINQVVQAASKGHFQQHICIENKTGFFKTFSESINQIMVFNKGIIEDTLRIFAALVQGDLTQTIENQYVGAFEQLKNDVNMTIKQLTKIMMVIKQTANAVSATAAEISQDNINLRQRTEEQAASLEETATSMEQITATVQQNADNAKQAAQLAINAKELASQGGEVVSATTKAMTEISDSSQQIINIISVIDDIAFQTNLLAINAAIEAARAGEQGRGFAVVALEIRQLAQHSAVAAKEIKALIQDNVKKGEEGTKQANQSGEMLQEILLAAKKVSDIISEIAVANQEHFLGISQINQVITQMDEITQQNAALVSRMASTSEFMRQQAQNLKQQVTFFNMGNGYT